MQILFVVAWLSAASCEKLLFVDHKNCFPQPSRSEAGKPASGRQEQHQDRRLRDGVVTAHRVNAGDVMRISPLRLPGSH